MVRTWPPDGDPVAVVVLVHGIAEHTGRYEEVGAILAERRMGVIAADLVGFGVTGGRRGHVDDWAVYLDQVQALVEEAQATGHPVVLLGHSMGGLIALEYALAERTSPDLLVLSAPGLAGGAAWQRMAAPMVARVAPTVKFPNSVKGEQLSRDPAVGEAYFGDPLVVTASTGRMGAELFAAMERTRRRIDRLDIPTLVLHGGLDTIVPPPSTVDLGAVAGVERRLYPTLRHELFNEPEGPEIVGEVADWIKERLVP